ncbi:DUF4870 domain-containing protein [Kribbella sp. NPDC048928]|uniref:DUF4870 domain-containing protein n=1 Tax=Kribbella sp. NPDC048928 TaxID=3364111 RepID=UPI00371202FB
MLDCSMSTSSARPMSATEERTWAMVAHAGVVVAAWIAMGFLCPLIVWLVFRNRSVRGHAVESLNFQISLLIYSAVASVLIYITFGFGTVIVVPVLVVGGIIALVLVILAAVAAFGGKGYVYPLTIRLVR